MFIDPIAVALFAAFGLALGSFLNVCIYRLPRRILLLDEIDSLERQADGAPRMSKEDVASKRSELKALAMWGTRSLCPECRQKIAWFDNVPLVSWLLLRGRCRRCQAHISARYFAVELLAALMFVGCYVNFGLTISAMKFCALSFFAIGLIFTDAEWKLLPDALTLPGMVVGLAFSAFTPVNDLAARWFPGLGSGTHASGWRLASLAQSALGAMVGAAFIYGAGMLYLRMRPDLTERGRQAMGLGDVKLMAMVGAFLGATLTVFTMFAASMAGALWGVATVVVVWVKRLRRQRARHMQPGRAWQSAVVAFRYFQVPFGVFLAGMALAAGFFGNSLMQWYWEYSSGVMR